MASNVWGCLMAYMNNSAKEIERDYNFDTQLIVKTLENYPKKNAYHGHESKKPGAPIAPETDTNLKAAIAYLRNHKPEKDSGEKKPPSSDPSKRQDPAKSATNKEKQQVQKIEQKATKQELSESLAKLLKTSAKANFEKNPKSGPVADLVKELAAAANIKGSDNKVLLAEIAKKFSNVKSASS